MSRAHSPVSDDEIISFCRKHLCFFEDLYQIDKAHTDTMPDDDDLIEEHYKDFKRRFAKKAREIYPEIKATFDYKIVWQAVHRMNQIYALNRNLINGFFDLSDKDKKAIANHSLLHDEEKAKHFEAGLIYARTIRQ